MDISLERAYPTPFVNSPLLPMLILSLARQKHTPKVTKNFEREYDYVIVGGGSAGSVLASRLSEEKCLSVLLLEAGKSAPLLTEIPGISRSFFYTDLDWQYKTVPQKHTGRALVNQEVPWPGGKGIGGSSILSALIYSRGNRKNYDDWAAQGAEGWSYEDVKPYFLKLENNTNKEYLEKGYHSSKGPLSIERPKYEAQIKKHILEAIEEDGYSLVDPNGAHQTGFYDFQAFLNDSQRCNTAKAYLVPAENRTNLHIVKNAFVKKVIIEGTEAVGVEFDHDDSSHTVKAKREVLLAAGAVNTAQLLMLSGIGPKKHLKKLNIPVKADLPVGNNFQDHVLVPLTFELNHTIPTTKERISSSENIQEYIDNRTGPLASAQFTSVVGFLKGAEVYFAEFTSELPKKQIGLKPQVYKPVFQPYEHKPLYFCGAHALQPKSKGTIRLRSADPYDSPLIDPNYFAHRKDVKDTVEALKVCHQLGNSEPMKKVGSRPLSRPIPGCEHKVNNLDRYLECMARSLVVTMSHPVGTAKMGDPSDPTTVVDPQLRVKGIKGLRVVDASVMPIIPSGNLNTPTIMVAEKASDLIKSTVRCSKHEDENSILNALFDH